MEDLCRDKNIDEDKSYEMGHVKTQINEQAPFKALENYENGHNDIETVHSDTIVFESVHSFTRTHYIARI